jgi:hypothetical protein
MTIQLDTIALPTSLIWSDEHAAQAVAQSARRTLDGSLLVLYAALQKGRAITLESREDAGWLTKTQVDALRLLADSPGGVYTLTLRGTPYQVMFRHHEPPAFSATPLFPFVNPQPGDRYLAVIRLMTV